MNEPQSFDTEGSLAAVEAKARALGVSLTRVCLAAGIAPSTVRRWKSGDSGMSVLLYNRLVEALRAIERNSGAEPPEAA